MKHWKRYLTLALTVALLLSTLCGIGMMATANDTATPDVLYLDPANCADLVPTSYTKGENNAFEVEGHMRWYFGADILKQYRYITVTMSGLPAGCCYIPMWGDVWFNGNTAAGNLTSQRLFNGTATMDMALEDLSAAGYTGFQLIPEGIPAGTKVTMTVSLHKTLANDAIYLDPANCADLVPTSYTKGENNAFEVEGNMRWYFDPAAVKGYNYITVTMSGLPAGCCYIPMWGDVWFNGNTAAGNLTNQRLFNGTTTMNLALEDLSAAGYTGFQLIPEGIPAGTKVTMTVSLSKNDPAEKVFLDPANCADLVPTTYTKGENNAFTAEGAMRWYFPSSMDDYRYIIISVDPWGDGNLCPLWGDQWMSGNSDAGNLVSMRILGGNVTANDTVIVLDRNLETFTPAYNGFQLMGENIAAGTTVSYNYVCLSKNAFPPLFNAPAEPEVSEPESSEPESSEPESSEPEVSEPESSEPEVSEPEVSEPEVSEPESSEPEFAEKVFLDPANCADVVPIVYTKGENNAFEVEGSMRWYFDPAAIEGYNLVTVTISGLPEGGCYVPMWGDVWLKKNTEAGNLISDRLFNGTTTMDLTLEDLSAAGYNGFQLIAEGIPAGHKVTMTVCLSKSQPEVSEPDSSEPEVSEPEVSEPDVPLVPETIELKFADAEVAKNVIAEVMGDGFKMYVNPNQTGIYKNLGDIVWKMKLDLSSLKTLTINAVENKTAFWLTVIICNEYGDPVDALPFPTYINGQPGKHVYDLATALAQKDSAYHTGEWNVKICIGIDDGGNKNADLYNVFDSIVLETKNMVPAPDDSEEDKNPDDSKPEDFEDDKKDEKPSNPSTGVASVLPLLLMAATASGALVLTRKKH